MKSTFSEYGHVAYQIKRNEAYNKINPCLVLVQPRNPCPDIFEILLIGT